MKNKILSDILKLKEGSGYHIIDFMYSKDENTNSPKIIFEGDMNFYFIIEHKIEDLLYYTMKLSSLYINELEMEMNTLENKEYPIISIGVIADDKGVSICSRIAAFSVTKANQNEVENLANKLNDINNELTEYLNNLLDTFAESIDIVKKTNKEI